MTGEENSALEQQSASFDDNVDVTVCCTAGHEMQILSGMPKLYLRLSPSSSSLCSLFSLCNLLPTDNVYCSVCRRRDLQNDQHFFHCSTCHFDKCSQCTGTDNLYSVDSLSSPKEREISFAHGACMISVMILYCPLFLSWLSWKKHEMLSQNLDYHPCTKLIIDSHEIEIMNSLEWTCVCGHTYSELDDGNGIEFRDLRFPWPCPSCGQQVAKNWHCRRLSEQHFWDTASNASWSSLSASNSVPSSARSTCHSELCQSSGALTSDYSWHSVFEQLPVPDSADTYLDIGCAAEAFDESRQGLEQWRCDSCHHVLLWKFELPWCPECSCLVAFPVFDSRTHSTSPEVQRVSESVFNTVSSGWKVSDNVDYESMSESSRHSPRPSEESDVFDDLPWVQHRIGIGRERSPVRPGLRAGGGIAGPWWTRADARLLHDEGAFLIPRQEWLEDLVNPEDCALSLSLSLSLSYSCW